MKKADKFILLLILLIGIYFRFSRITDFQYWSGDEQLFYYIVRHIVVDGHLSLTVPNTAIGAGLGSVFHLLVSPWYLINNLNPEKILVLGNFIGLINIFLIYLAGKTVGGKKVGFISAFLYATSFMSTLFDHRFWALTPSVALVSLSIIGFTNTLKGKQIYFPLIAFPIGFMLNSDPSLGVIALTCLLFFIIFRPRIQKKYLLVATGVFLLLISTLIIFDFRHNFNNVKSVFSHANARIEETDNTRTRSRNIFIEQTTSFGRFLFAKPSKSADSYFCYCFLDDGPNGALIITSIILITFIFIAFKKRKKEYLLLLLYLVSYLIGILGFREILEGNPAFFYAIVVSPIIFIITSIVISKNKNILILFLAFYFLANLSAFQNSSFKYPLKDKMSLVQKTIEQIPDNSDYSLYHSGDILLAGGGWSALFNYYGKPPVMGNLPLYWGHAYEAYDLYPVKFDFNEQKYVVVLSESSKERFLETEPVFSTKVNNIRSDIYDNSEVWFDNKNNIERLYQPNYFSDPTRI